MNPPAGPSGGLFNPFPGLRPFTQEESHLFFGREGQSKSVLKSLEKNQFVAVIGASGSGKSSLIYCGVIPELLKSSSTPYISVPTRPGNSPIKNLLHSIAVALKKKPDSELPDLISSGKRGFLDWLNEILPEGKSLLLVVDQFEEIFRYKRSASEKDLNEIDRFVELLHNSCSAKGSRVKIVLTMRSDFIGECSVYQDLTDLINRSNYLIPQMTTEDFRSAIEGPAKLGGGKLETPLVDQLLEEVGENTDQLPVLQHALMRTWDYWMLQNDPDRVISIGDYEAIGRMSKALSDHANEAYDELDEEQRLICERIFKTITEKGGDNRGIRRPAPIHRIAEISRCSVEEVIAIADVFRSGGRTFLTPYKPVELSAETVLDISHESLMRIWDRLRLWVDEEAGSVQMYKRLSQASALYQEGTTGLWRPPDLQLAINWRERQKPTATWAVQYNPAFERAMVYLDASDADYKKEEENKIRLQKRRLRVTRMFSLVLGGIAIIAMGLFLWTRDLQNVSEQRRLEAVAASELAEQRAEEARMEKLAADTARMQAEERRIEAEKAQEEARLSAIQAQRSAAAATAARNEALDNFELAKRNEEQARRNADSARVQEQRAIAASELAQQRRMLSIAKSMAVKSLSFGADDDVDLKGLLAYQAYSFNLENQGPEHESDIYAGLYDARKAILGENYNRFGGHSQSINSLQFVPGTDQFYSASSDGKILKHALSDTSRSFEILDERDDLIKAMAISPDGGILVSGTEFSGIYVYDLNQPDLPPKKLFGHDGRIRDLVFSADAEALFSIGVDKTILKWKIAAGTSEVFSTSGVRYTDIALSADGKTLAASDQTGDIQLISTADKEKIDTIKGSALNPYFSLDFSDDGRYLAAGDRRGNVRIFDAVTRAEVNSLVASNARIKSVNFSPKSTFLASSSLDGSVYMWETSNFNNTPIQVEDLSDYVFTVEFSPDADFLLSASSDIISNPVRLVQLAEDFCMLIKRNFSREEWSVHVGVDIPYANTCPDIVTQNSKQ